MKTIGYGLVQIPIVTSYRVCCIRRTLAGGVTSTGWQEIIACALRILLLSSWGLKSIDYTLPQTAEKIIGVYVEFAVLALLFANGIVVLMALWSGNLYLFYPTFVIIPTCFVTDIIVKGSCYAALFLTPKVTSFGVISLVEVWFRGFSLMYGWIIVISYVYYKRKDWKLTEVDVQLTSTSASRANNLVRKTSSKSPFSRQSSLSQRGRRSFLLRKESEKSITSGNIYSKSLEMSPPSQNYCPEPEDDVDSSTKDGESEVLLGESATMSLRRGAAPRLSQYNIPSPVRSDNSSKRLPQSTLQRSPPRYKKRGGFVPEVLRTPSTLAESAKPLHLQGKKNGQRLSPQSSFSDSANTIELSSRSAKYYSENDEAALLSKSVGSKKTTAEISKPQKLRGPPSLPSRPPVATASKPAKSTIRSSPMSWFKKSKEKPDEVKSSSLDVKHIPEPVLV